MIEKFDLIWRHIFIPLNRRGDCKDVLLVTVFKWVLLSVNASIGSLKILELGSKIKEQLTFIHATLMFNN
jgi:hypothetical protein